LRRWWWRCRRRRNCSSRSSSWRGRTENRGGSWQRCALICSKDQEITLYPESEEWCDLVDLFILHSYALTSTFTLIHINHTFLPFPPSLQNNSIPCPSVAQAHSIWIISQANWQLTLDNRIYCNAPVLRSSRASLGKGGPLPLVARQSNTPSTQIVHIHMQHAQLIYKIRFFNDNT
jgi:hypothetical protein